MAVKVPIGDFSRMTHLSVKTLRHYHDIGLLDPAAVDAETGYRSYDLSQVGTAQVIRRFRNLGMPVEHIKAVLTAKSIDERNNLIVEHMKLMEAELERTQGIVASLRTLLEGPLSPPAIEYRSVPAMHIAAITKPVELPHIEPWWSNSFAELRSALRQQRITAAGPQGGLYPTELYTNEVGEVTLFIPISEPMMPSGNVIIRELPPAELAIAVHRGALSDADRTYAPLGTHVLEKMVSVAGPIRENYLVTDDDTDDEGQLVTEIGWPIFRTIPS